MEGCELEIRGEERNNPTICVNGICIIDEQKTTPDAVTYEKTIKKDVGNIYSKAQGNNHISPPKFQWKLAKFKENNDNVRNLNSTENRITTYTESVPRFLRTDDKVLRKSKSDDRMNLTNSPEQTTFNLPPRYELLKNGKVTGTSGSLGKLSDDFESRGKDLDTAIRWLRHEIFQMKMQDKVLARQFMDMQSTIHFLKENASYNQQFSSGSDIASLDGSTASLDERTLTRSNSVRANGYLRSSHDFLPDFRGRTASMHTPRTKNRFSLRPKSKEYS